MFSSIFFGSNNNNNNNNDDDDEGNHHDENFEDTIPQQSYRGGGKGGQEGTTAPSGINTNTASETQQQQQQHQQQQEEYQFSSWKEAQNTYCETYGVLRVSIDSILAEYCTEGQDLTFELPKKNKRQNYITSSLDDFLQYQNQQQQQDQKSNTNSNNSSILSSTSSLVFGVTKRVATGILSKVIWSHDDEYDDEYDTMINNDNGNGDGDNDNMRWGQADDDALAYYDSSSATSAAAAAAAGTTSSLANSSFLSEPLINVEWTRQCLELLQNYIVSSSSSSSSLLVSPKNSTDNTGSSTLDATAAPRVMWKSEWKAFCQQAFLQYKQQQENNDPSMVGDTFPPAFSIFQNHKTPKDTFDFLLELLVRTNHAKIIKDENSSLSNDKTTKIVVGVGVTNQSTNQTQQQQQQDIATNLAVTLFDLQHSQKQLEQQIEAWSIQSQECERAALKYKKNQHQQPLALAQMAKRKLLQTRIETASASLIKLEQIQASLEMSQSNAAIIKIMSQSNEVLKQFNSLTTLEHVDSIHDSLQEQMEDLQEIQQAMNIGVLPPISSLGVQEEDDDELLLLKELEELTLSDIQTTTTSTNIQTTTTTTTTPEYNDSSSSSSNNNKNKNQDIKEADEEEDIFEDACMEEPNSIATMETTATAADTANHDSSDTSMTTKSPTTVKTTTKVPDRVALPS